MATPKLQQELKKKRPFDSPEQEAILNILRTNDQFQVRFARLFRPFGLTPSQYNVLRILRGAGTRGLSCREIGERMFRQLRGGLSRGSAPTGHGRNDRDEERKPFAQHGRKISGQALVVASPAG